jgi:hypothetical protein
VLQLRELDLQLASLVCARCEKISRISSVRSIHAPVQLLLQVSALRGRELVVEHHAGGVQLGGRGRDLADLALAGVEPRIGPLAPALHDFQALDAGALDEARGFLDAFFIAGVAEIQANDDCRLRVGRLRV